MNNGFTQLEQLFKELIQHTEFENHCWYVGGYVRDLIVGRDPKDMDIVINIKYGPRKLTKYIFDTLTNEVVTTPTRLGHYPIWQITFREGIFWYNGIKYQLDTDQVIEVAETMSETFPDKNSRQRKVMFDTLENDILRRDFSCNSLLKNVTTGEIVDLVGGINDIHNRVIKCNSGVNPTDIFDQDPLRMLRLIVFAVRYNWKIDFNTANSVINRANRIQIISSERVIKELKKVCEIKHGLYQAVLMMDQLGLLQYIFPDIYHLKSINQAPDVRKIHLEGSEWIFSNFVDIDNK